MQINHWKLSAGKTTVLGLFEGGVLRNRMLFLSGAASRSIIDCLSMFEFEVQFEGYVGGILLFTEGALD